MIFKHNYVSLPPFFQMKIESVPRLVISGRGLRLFEDPCIQMALSDFVFITKIIFFNFNNKVYGF